MEKKRGIWRTVQSVLFFVLIYTTTIYAQSESTEPQFGWVKAETDLDSVYVVIDRQFQNARLMTSGGNSDSIKVAEGTHTLTLVWKTIHDQKTTVEVFPGETTTVKFDKSSSREHPKSSYSVVKQQYNLEISSAGNAEIYVNGQFAGVEKARIFQLHKHADLEIVHPKKGKIKFKTEVSTFNTTEVARYYSDRNKRGLHYYLIPYWKQAYHNESGKMMFTTFSYIAFGALTYAYGEDIADKRLNYREVKIAYMEAPNAWRAYQHKKTLTKNHKKLSDSIRLQNLMIGGIVATYAIGVIDAVFFRPKEGYHGPGKFGDQPQQKKAAFIPEMSMSAGDGVSIGFRWRL